MRQSNFELLRIMAMFAIVLHHLIINAINVVGYNNPFVGSFNNDTLLIINSMLVGGVNSFVLISGYFGIKVSKRSIIRLIFDSFIFALIGLLICYLMTGDHFMLKPSSIWNNCKFTHYWFVTHYLILMLVSPIIESSLNNVTYKVFSLWICILLVINVYFGYCLHVVNENGYNFVNFIMLYYIGKYIRVSKEKGWFRTMSQYSLAISIMTCILFSIIYIIISNYTWIKGVRFWGYNSPWVLLSSILFFIFISKLAISNKWINTMAHGTFGIYLLQGGESSLQ